MVSIVLSPAADRLDCSFPCAQSPKERREISPLTDIITCVSLCMGGWIWKGVAYMQVKNTYVFPAVLSYEEGFEIGVTFPDLPGCVSCGSDETEALTMGKEALSLHLWGMETDDEEIPEPTRLCDLSLESNERSILIEVFMPTIRLSQETRSVSRTVTLPAWLNAAALEKGINFSQALQSTLVKDYGLSK